MIAHGVDEDPVVLQLLRTQPGPLLKRISPAVAAAAIADGLETRSSRVIKPARWRPISALRGVIGPVLDARFATDRRILDLLARLDERPSPTRSPHTPERRP